MDTESTSTLKAELDGNIGIITLSRPKALNAINTQMVAELELITNKNTVMLEGLALFYNLHASELRLRAYNEIHASAYVRWDRAKEQLGNS